MPNSLWKEAIWIKHMLRVIEEPDSPKSILTRMRIAPSIKWDNLMRDRGATKTARINIPNEKYDFINNWIKTTDFDHLNTNQELKHIYNDSIDLIEWDQEILKGIKNLNKIKQPELWIVGYQTLHQGHKTLSWFKKHNFDNIGDITIDGNCTTCQVRQTQEHIFNDCMTTENLRKHINTNRKNWTNISENMEPSYEILTYQKAAIEMTRRINHNISQNKELITSYQELKAMFIVPNTPP